MFGIHKVRTNVEYSCVSALGGQIRLNYIRKNFIHPKLGNYTTKLWKESVDESVDDAKRCNSKLVFNKDLIKI